VQGRSLLKLAGQVLEQARGRDGRLQSQPCDQPVNDHMGEPFDLRVDGSDRLVGELSGGTGEGAHALINSSVTLEAGMLGLESSVKWRGPTRFEQRRLRCRESTPDAYRGRVAPGRIAVAGIGLPGPSSTYGQRRRAHGELRGGASPAPPWRWAAGGVARAAPGLSPGGLPPGHVAACSRRGRDCLVNRPDLAGQRARVGAARRRPDLRAGNRCLRVSRPGRARQALPPESTVEPRCGSG
jgi:hypothetical protein